MRIGTTIVALVLTVALSACSDDSDGDSEADPSAQASEITIDCDEFEETAAKITQAQTELYAGTGGSAAIDTLASELEALADDAPDDVQAALTDMAEAFREAQDLLEDPTREKQQELADLAPELAEDSQTITDYVVSQCD